MRQYNGKVQVASYIDVELFNRIEYERKQTGESQSGIIASILDACFREPV